MDNEQAVEAMIEHGSQIMRQALDQYRPIAILAAYSGGNDSIVSTHFACKQFSAAVVHCNTNIGITRTRKHVRDTSNKFGWQLKEQYAQPEGKPGLVDETSLPIGHWTDGTAYEEFVLNYGFPGPAQHGRMYQRLKERPLAKLVAELKLGHSNRANVLIVSGIRHDESAIRAGYRKAIQKDGGKIWVNPFYFQTAIDFEFYRQEFGLPRNPVSDRIGISGECLCGAFAKDGEKEKVRSVEPEIAKYLDLLEERVLANGFPWSWGKSPPQWWLDERKGQGMLFEMGPEFQPMCVGCVKRRPTR